MCDIAARLRPTLQGAVVPCPASAHRIPERDQRSEHRRLLSGNRVFRRQLCSDRYSHLSATPTTPEWIAYGLASTQLQCGPFARRKPPLSTWLDRNMRKDYSFAYSALACLRAGMSASASFQRVRIFPEDSWSRSVTPE
jgi:hypothetical protein